MRQTGLFGLPDHLRKLSATGDPLEVLAKVVDFEIFRAPLEAALGYSDGSRGGRPAYDAVAMFKVLVLAARHTVSDERMEFLIRDRLSWLRFLGFDLGAPTPDRNTIWTFRERLVRAGAMDELFAAFDGELRRCGYLAMGGQIVDATLVSAPKQRDRDDEKRAIKAGKSASEVWPDQPAKAAQKDTDARWTVKTGRRKNPAGSQRRVPDIAIPVFGYKNHVVIDRAYGFIRGSAVTDAARHDGKMMVSWAEMPRSSPPVDPLVVRPATCFTTSWLVDAGFRCVRRGPVCPNAMTKLPTRTMPSSQSQMAATFSTGC